MIEPALLFVEVYTIIERHTLCRAEEGMEKPVCDRLEKNGEGRWKEEEGRSDKRQAGHSISLSLFPSLPHTHSIHVVHSTGF